MSSNFERIGTEKIYEGKFFDVERGTFRHEDGTEVKRENVTHPRRGRRRRARWR